MPLCRAGPHSAQKHQAPQWLRQDSHLFIFLADLLPHPHTNPGIAHSEQYGCKLYYHLSNGLCLSS